MSEPKAALIIIYNHRFDSNIARLESMYADRFDEILHLVPFYNGSATNVVTVYESSFFFQGYLAQASRQIAALTAEHYLFIGDDLVIHPEINQDSYAKRFQVDANSSFVPEIQTLDSVRPGVLNLRRGKLLDVLLRRTADRTKWLWIWTESVFKYSTNPKGVNGASELPNFNAAQALLERHGIKLRPLRAVDISGLSSRPTSLVGLFKFVAYLWRQYVSKSEYQLPYPIVLSYSDIVVVNRNSLNEFLRLCGLFAATGLFVEAAIPTALCMACSDVRTERSLQERGKVFWVYTEAQKIAYTSVFARYGQSLEALMTDFPENCLYIHPIKLSMWN